MIESDRKIQDECYHSGVNHISRLKNEEEELEEIKSIIAKMDIGNELTDEEDALLDAFIQKKNLTDTTNDGNSDDDDSEDDGEVVNGLAPARRT